MDQEQPDPSDAAELRTAIARLANEVAALARRVDSLEATSATRQVSAASDSSQKATARPTGTQQTPLVTKSHAPPIPKSVQSTSPPPLPKQQTPRPDQALLEAAIGGRVLTWLGGFILILAVGFAIHWWWTTFTVPIWLRIVGMHLLGLGFLIAAFTTRKRWKLPILSQGLLGVGIFTLYASAYAALRLYQVWSEPVAFVEFATITLLAIVLAISTDSIGVILLGALGGYLTPFLTATEEGSHVTLFLYLAFLNVAILVAAIRKGWNILKPITLAATAFMFLAWMSNGYQDQFRWSTEWLLALHTIIQWIAVVLPAFVLSRRTDISDHFSATANPLFYFLLTGVLFHRAPNEQLAALSLALGGFHFALFAAAYRSIGNEDRLPRVFLAVATIFVTLAIPIYLQDGSYLGIAWCIEGAVFTAIAIYFCDPQLRVSGLIMFALGLIRLWGIDFVDFDFDPSRSWYQNELFVMLFASAVLVILAGILESTLPRRTMPTPLDRDLGRALANLYLAAGNVLFLLSFTTQWRDRFVLTLWILDVALLWAFAFLFDLLKTRTYAFAVAMLMVNGMALHLGFAPGDGALTLVNSRFFTLTFMAAVYLAAGLAYANLAQQHPNLVPPSNRTRQNVDLDEPFLQYLLGILGNGILLAAISFEIRDWFHPDGWFWQAGRPQMPMSELASYSIAWATYAATLIASGFVIRYALYRWLGLGLFVLVVIKVFLVDLANIDLLPRVLAFAALGIALLLTSLLYQRYAARLTATPSTQQ